jgi:aspartyl-tRNA(Asn)/glutamyl-tRNA(Gln) amidotransferase subunit C
MRRCIQFDWPGKMKIDRETIQHLEALARVELDDADREKFADQLARIVKFVEKLDELDTSGIHHETHRGSQPVNPDDPSTWRGQKKVLDQAPACKNGFFRVPRVIERGEDG